MANKEKTQNTTKTTTEHNMTAGSRLSSLIKKHYKSELEFSKAVGISNKLINNYCKNKSNIPTDKLLKIENAVGFSST